MQRKRPLAARWLAIGAVGLLLPSLALGAQDDENGKYDSLTPPIEEMSRSSDLVVVGKVLRNHSRWVGKLIVTTSEVQPFETLKGDGIRDTFEVSFLGGTVGVINQHVNHEATLQEDEVAVLFLAKPIGEAAKLYPGLRIVDERGAIRMVDPGAPESRFKDNRRVQSYLKEIASRVREGER